MSTAGASLRYLPTAVTVLALRPWPWVAASLSLGVRPARAETFWYPLLMLAFVALKAVWRDPRVLAFPVLAGATCLAM